MVTLLLKCRVIVCVSLMSVYCAPAFFENMGVYFHALRVHEFFENPGKSQNLRYQNVYEPCIMYTYFIQIRQ